MVPSAKRHSPPTPVSASPAQLDSVAGLSSLAAGHADKWTPQSWGQHVVRTNPPQTCYASGGKPTIARTLIIICLT